MSGCCGLISGAFFTAGIQTPAQAQSDCLLFVFFLVVDPWTHPPCISFMNGWHILCSYSLFHYFWSKIHRYFCWKFNYYYVRTPMFLFLSFSRIPVPEPLVPINSPPAQIHIYLYVNIYIYVYMHICKPFFWCHLNKTCEITSFSNLLFLKTEGVMQAEQYITSNHRRLFSMF